MRILGLIPAREGSKGVPNKNSAFLGNKPLICYSIEAAKESQYLTEILISTDSLNIFKIAKEFQCEPPFIRPIYLAEDSSSSIDVVMHAIDFFENKNIFFDAVCLLQPTSPFREKGFIDFSIQKFIEKKVDSLISVLPIPHEFNPHWAFEETANGLLKIATGEKEIIKRRQELPKAFHRDGSLYITKIDVIKKGRFYGKTVGFIESNPDFYVNIDSTQDWIKAENILKKYINEQ